jgi:hypothetical protein
VGSASERTAHGQVENPTHGGSQGRRDAQDREEVTSSAEDGPQDRPQGGGEDRQARSTSRGVVPAPEADQGRSTKGASQADVAKDRQEIREAASPRGERDARRRQTPCGEADGAARRVAEDSQSRIEDAQGREEDVESGEGGSTRPKTGARPRAPPSP